jgi:VanZ family protein
MTPPRWRALLFALMLAGLLFSIRPLTSPLEPERLFRHSDKVGHVVYFGLLWLLARRAGFAAGWCLALALLGFGVGIEVAQHLVPTGRSASLSDVAADVLGILLGWWAARTFSIGQPQEHRR